MGEVNQEEEHKRLDWDAHSDLDTQSRGSEHALFQC